MSYSTTDAACLPPVFLSPWNSGLVGRGNHTTAPVSGTLGAVNRIVYCPIQVGTGVWVYRHFWLNGATASTDTVNVAVYDTAFSRIAVGSGVTSSGANVCQFENVTDYYLAAGRYYLALWCSGTTATFFRAAAAPFGVYYETHASGPQATGTPADPATVSPQHPVFGLALRATDP